MEYFTMIGCSVQITKHHTTNHCLVHIRCHISVTKIHKYSTLGSITVVSDYLWFFLPVLM
jgi:hypothetical protein